VDADPVRHISRLNLRQAWRQIDKVTVKLAIFFVGGRTMEVFSAYLTESRHLLNGVTAFSVVQALTFVYWSQTDDFKDTVRFPGHLAALAGIFIFMLLYWSALWIISHEQLSSISQLSDDDIKSETNLTFGYLKREALRSIWHCWVVVLVFRLLSAVSLVRYSSNCYNLPKDRLVVQ
jgi:hypothetical protein